VQNEILLNSVYIDPGATAMDDVDGDISDAVVVDTSALDTSEVGVYRIEYRVRDSAGCEIRAERFVRVIALVPTSDLTQLTGLCSSNIPRIRELCGAVAALDANAPNPAAFPGCCIALSDMDEAGCFCVPDVIAGFEGESPSVAQLAAFTPLACGFRVKVGAVCEDQQLLSQFLSTPTAVPELVIPDDVWETIVDEDGVLREDIGCNDTLTVVRKYCGAVTTNAGFAPRVADFAPCCAAAARLYNNTCLCDEPELITDENFVFVRELVGFTPLGCGFNYTDECPALVDRLSLETTIVEIPTPGDVRTIPISIPVLSPLRTEPTTTLEAGLAGGLAQIDASGNQVARFADGSSAADVFGFSGAGSCLDYAALIPELCASVGINRKVSVYNLTGCCVLLRAMHDTACLCPPYAETWLGDAYDAYEIVAREGCGIQIDTPPRLGCASDEVNDEIYDEKDFILPPRVAPEILVNLQAWLNAEPVDVNATSPDGDGVVAEPPTNGWLPSGVRNISTAIPNTQSCLEALLATEISCIPAITGAREAFSLDASWQACCRRLTSIDINRCLCDGAVALAMTTTPERRRLHRQFLRLAPNACGLDVTIGERCPVAEFIVADEGAADVARVSTMSADDATAFMDIEAPVYERTDTVTSTVLANGGMVLSNPQSQTTFPRGFTIVSPRPDAPSATTVTAEGVVEFESAAIPGARVRVEPSDDGTTFIGIDGTVRRLHVPMSSDAAAADVDPSDSAVSIANDTAVAQTRDDIATIPLGETSEGESGGIAYTQASQELRVELPDDTTVTITYPETRPPPTTAPPPLPPSTGAPIVRPLEGYGVVVENGVPVPEGAPGLSACDPIRTLRNFLVVGFQPGSTSYDVLGAIACCANATVKIPEVTGVVGYRPRGAINTFVDAPSVPNVTCRGLSIISASGETLDDTLCDRTTVEATSAGVSFTLRDIELCPNCAITGSRDGVLFTVQHASDATLNTLSPVVRALQCDTSGTWARATERPIGGDGTRRRRLLQQFFGGVPFFPMQQNTSSGAFAPPLVGFNLTQYAQPSTRRDFDGYFDPTGDDDPTGDFGGVACRTILPRVSSSLRWFGARANVSGPYQTAPFEDYTFTGSISLDSGDGQSATLTDVNVPVVLSAWVNNATTGEWRNVVDPLEEYRIECFPTRVARGTADAESQVASTPSADPCGGLRFFMSSYAPEGVFASNENAGATPQVTLLEISLSQVSLCAGCSLQGSNEDGALFKITSRTNARFDYVGPSVGNPTCVTDLRGRSVSPEGVDGETIPIVPPPMLVDNTTEVECNGVKGLNLKGILLRDGSKFITDTEDECCMACAMTRDCDIWVYCTGDCVDFSYHSCWLKRSIGGGFTRERGPTDVAAWDRGPDVPWTSGWFVRDETREPGPSPPPPAIPSVPDSATYFTLQPGVGVQIPASIITVIPGAQVPGNETTSEPPSSSPPTTNGIFPPPPSNVAPTTPLPVPTPVPASPPSTPPPGLTPLPSGGDPARACVEGDALICPTESTPDALGLADVRLSVQLQSVSPSQAALTGTVINFGRVHDRVCLAGVSVTIPFDKTVINPSTSEQSVAASASDFIVECVFVGVRTRDGPPSDDANGCGTYASAAVVDAGIELTFRNVALCKECWIVGGPAGVLFTIRHRDNWLLTLPEETLANQNAFTESAATCAPVR